ncbi:Secreted Nerve growth factor-like protein [Gryllus bimaculatus]|nr:Secreted Nerve growth factor-like protein [Gryllus bimaculatus]
MRIVARPSCVAPEWNKKPECLWCERRHVGVLQVLCLVASVLLRAATSSAWQIGDSAGDRTLAAAAAEWDLRRLSGRELQTLLRNASGESGAAECCPSRMDMVMPGGGIRVDGLYVELFQLQEQSFYEVSCLDSVRDKPCRFIDRRLQAQSRCVQKYSYSGCACEIVPTKAQKKRQAGQEGQRGGRCGGGARCGAGGAAAGAGADDPPRPAPAPPPTPPSLPRGRMR